MNKSPNQIDIHIGKRIRMRRMMLNMSQGALGAPCDITFQQIQKYESGANRVGASRLQQFSKLLGVPVAFFFDGLTPTGVSPKNAKQDFAQQLLTRRDGIDLIKAFMSIRSKSLRRAIIAVVEEIAKR